MAMLSRFHIYVYIIVEMYNSNLEFLRFCNINYMPDVNKPVANVATISA